MARFGLKRTGYHSELLPRMGRGATINNETSKLTRAWSWCTKCIRGRQVKNGINQNCKLSTFGLPPHDPATISQIEVARWEDRAQQKQKGKGSQPSFSILESQEDVIFWERRAGTKASSREKAKMLQPTLPGNRL